MKSPEQTGGHNAGFMTADPDSFSGDGRWTAHLDTYVLDGLPPPEAQPVFLFDGPGLDYPPALNAAGALIDDAISRGWGERIAIAADDGPWTYRRLFDPEFGSIRDLS